MAAHLQALGIKEVRIAGFLRERRGYWHMSLSWMNFDGSRGRKSQSTGLPIKGNKKRAEDSMDEIRTQLQTFLNHAPDHEPYENDEVDAFLAGAPYQEKELQALLGRRGRRHVVQGTPSDAPRMRNLLFADFLEDWLEIIRHDPDRPLKPTTFGAYQTNVQRVIAPYFRKKGILLCNLTAEDITEFYTVQRRRVKESTVLKFHANLNSALKYALEHGYITQPIMERAKRRPKRTKFMPNFYRESQVMALCEAAKGHKLEVGILFAAFYGMRRSEIIGLWRPTINFEANSFTIGHTVTEARIDGKKVIIAEDSTKSPDSLRTYPLIPYFRDRLLEIMAEQDRNQKLCGKSYNREEGKYIWTDALGNRVKPSYVTNAFPEFLAKHGFDRIRFHDLRHSCASLLLAQGVSLKEIQEWLGHSTYQFTADTYAHLDFSAKVKTAEAMPWINNLSFGAHPPAP